MDRRVLIAGLVVTGAGLAWAARDVSSTAVEVRRDLGYGPHARHRFDLYLPAGGEASLPLVVFFPGGGWQGGSKDDAAFVGHSLAEAGLVVAVANYRLYPDVTFPTFLEDGAAAVRRIRAELGEGGRKLVLMGHSAGAHLALMLALDPSWLSGLRPAAAIGIAGPYDHIPLDPDRRAAIFGDETRIAEALPISFVHSFAPPVLAVVGSRDRVIEAESADRLAARLRAAGAPAWSRTYFGLGHVGILDALGYPLRLVAPVRDDILRFIRAHA